MTNTRWSTVAGTDVQAKTSAEALTAAGLDWKVLQTPILYKDTAGVMQVVDNRKANIRSDNGHILGIVSDIYKVLQNKDAFRFLDSLVGYADAMYVNAGSFRDGAHVYIQAKLPGSIRFDDGGEDIGEKYLTFVTSHDGGLPVSVMFSPVRIICQNTLLMALRDNVRKSSIRHTLNMAIGLNQVRETLGMLNNHFTLLENLSQKMSKQPFKVDDIPQLLQKAGAISKETAASARAKAIIEEVTNRYLTGAGSELKSANGTVWGAYNAVVEYVDHFRGSDSLKRAQSSILGAGADIKTRTFELLSAI